MRKSYKCTIINVHVVIYAWEQTVQIKIIPYRDAELEDFVDLIREHIL